MSPELGKINDLLVSVYHDIIVLEERQLQAENFSDLSMTEIHTIEKIGMYKKKTASDVAKELSITLGTLTTAVNKLVKKGYVERLRSEDDKRVVKLGLTKNGRLVYRAHESFHHKMINHVLSNLDEAEVSALTKGLENLHGFLGQD